MSVRSGQVVSCTFTLRAFGTGQSADADSPPSGSLLINRVATVDVVTVTHSSTGQYAAHVTLPTLANGDSVEILIAATVGNVSDKWPVFRDACDISLDANGHPKVVDTDGSALASASTALSNVVWTSALAGYVANLNISGLVASATGLSSVALDAASAASAANAASANTVTILARLGAFLGTGLDTVFGFFRSLMRKDANLTPSAVGGTYDNTLHSLEALRNQGDVAWATATGFAVPGSAMTLTGPTLTAIQSVIWSAGSGLYNVAGTMGGKVNDSGSIGNPWSVDLSSGFGVNTAGYILFNGVQLSATGLDQVYPESGINARQALSALMAVGVGVDTASGSMITYAAAGNPAIVRVSATMNNKRRQSVNLNLPA